MSKIVHSWKKESFALDHIVHVCSVSDFLTPRATDCQAPLSMEFSRQGYWSGLSFPSPGDLPNPGTEPAFPTLVGRFFFY